MSAEFQPDDELLSAYLDGELAADELRAVEAWIERDPNARAMVDELRSVSLMVQSLPPSELPAGWSAKLAARLDQASPSSSSPSAGGSGDAVPSISFGRTARGWWWSAAAIAAAVAIMAYSQFATVEPPGDVALKQPAPGGEVPRPARERPVPELRAAVPDEDASEPIAATPLDASAARSEPATPSDDPLTADDDFASSEYDRLAAESLASGRPAAMPAAAPGPTATLTAAGEPQLIVWAKVPPEALRQQQIKKLLLSNGIQVEDRPQGDLAVATRAQQQIELRNSQLNRELGVGGQADASLARRGGRAESSRFSVPDAADNRQPRGRAADGAMVDDALEIEGETLLVEATADQIAACLAEMERDTENFKAITVEPVQTAPASQLRELAPQSIAGEVLDRSAEAVEELAEGQGGPAPTLAGGAAEQQAAPQFGFGGGTLEQAQNEAQPRAWRLDVPGAWYYSNSPPQDAATAYQVRSDLANQSQAASKSTSGDSDKREQLANLNRLLVNQNTQSAATSPRTQPPQVLTEQQPVQVLFVFRNSYLPNPAALPAAAGQPASEAAPRE